MGRTGRIRARKKLHYLPTNTKPCFMKLLKFMGAEGFSAKRLSVANFSSTGRGMMARDVFARGDTLISLPNSLLIGVTQAVSVSDWCHMLRKFKSSFTSMQLLCVFLIEGRHKVTRKDCFHWTAYIESLPSRFNHHIFWSMEILELLPDKIFEKAKVMREKVWQEFELLKKSFFYHSEAYNVITWDAYRWAWCCVNSRCIFSNHESPPRWKFLINSNSDCYYLAPFLDMFNHHPDAKVLGKYNYATKCYEIRTLQKWKKYEQVFICYGPHSTEDLFLEYGFLCPVINYNDVISITPQCLLNITKKKLCNKCMKELRVFFTCHRLDEGWTAGNDGISFNFRISILLYSSLLVYCLSSQCHLISHKKTLNAMLLTIEKDDMAMEVVTQANHVQNEILNGITQTLRVKYSIYATRMEDVRHFENEDELSIVEYFFKLLLRIFSENKK